MTKTSEAVFSRVLAGTSSVMSSSDALGGDTVARRLDRRFVVRDAVEALDFFADVFALDDFFATTPRFAVVDARDRRGTETPYEGILLPTT